MMNYYFENCDIYKGLNEYEKLCNISKNQSFSLPWKAIRCMQKQLSESEFESTIVKLSRLNADDCLVNRYMAMYAYNREDYSECLMYNAVVEKCGQLISSDYLRQGIAYYYLGDHERSLENFRKAYSLGVDAANSYSKSLLGVDLARNAATPDSPEN